MPSLTGLFDKITKSEDLSKIYGTLLYNLLIDVPKDLFTRYVSNKILSLLFATAFAGLASKAGGTTTRLGFELHEIASHELLKVADPTPEQIQIMKKELENLKRAIGLGDAKEILRALFRTPEEVKLALGIGAPRIPVSKAPVPKKETKKPEKVVYLPLSGRL